MADRIKFAVSAIPIETLTDENSGSKDIIASEIGRSLGGGGDSISLANYSGLADAQGYKDGAVNYREASYSAGGTVLSTTEGDFVYIKNTGYKYGTATVLGASTTDCVIVALHTVGFEDGTQSGWSTSALATDDHYFELAFLKAGQAVLFPLGSKNLAITQFGDTASDFTNLNNQNTQSGTAVIRVKTVESDGSAATTSNAVEFLVTT